MNKMKTSIEEAQLIPQASPVLINETEVTNIMDEHLVEVKPSKARWWRRSLDFLVWLLKSISLG